ncbi:MAG: formylglycine-generating enzyme family protein, partial [Gammaproteobacteria bacterium]
MGSGSSAWTVWWLSRKRFPARDERPRHRVALPTFYIGRFPVTNAEYRCFIEDGGYQTERYWPTEAARAWLSGGDAEAMAEELEFWRRLKEDPGMVQRSQFETRVLVTEWHFAESDDDGGTASFQGTPPRSREEPAYWRDEHYTNPAQPVVGVTWYEAVAYTRWLDRKLREAEVTMAGGLKLADGYEVRLPTEAQWEKAARMRRGWSYPWGEHWDQNRANTAEGHVLRPSPVGVYPLGATPEGVHELGGNVCEWTQSLYADYPYRTGAERSSLDAQGHRVVRGGSCLYGYKSARCAYRNGYIPDLFDGPLGFRVALS